MDRIEPYTASDGRLYMISVTGRTYLVTFGGDVFTLGQQPASMSGPWDIHEARRAAIHDIETRIRPSGSTAFPSPGKR
jgi:hypothetical protein